MIVAFANTAGGTLLIGVEDRSRMFSHKRTGGVILPVLQAVLLLAAAAASSAQARVSAAETKEGRAVVQQLRIYEIFEGNKGAFHERFRDHAMRIMARYDFKIVAIWETRHADRTEFVYLLEWPDEATMKDRWGRFMADKEWAEIKKATSATHGAMVGEIEDRVLTPTAYSPRNVLLP